MEYLKEMISTLEESPDARSALDDAFNLLKKHYDKKLNQKVA